MPADFVTLFERFSRQQSAKDREVVSVRILEKRGVGRALVRLPTCEGSAGTVAQEPSPIACGATAQAVVNRVTGAVTILPAPRSEAGQSFAFTASVRGDEPAPIVTEVPIYSLRYTSGTSFDVYGGIWYKLQDKDTTDDPGFVVDYGTSLATITWGTPTWDATDGYKLWLLPDGGGGLGVNSVAQHIRRRSGDSANLGGQSILRVWDGVAETVTEWTTGVNGQRIEQPVADVAAGLWWFVLFEVPAGFAKLCTMPLDLSSGPTVIGTSATTANSPRSFWLTATEAYVTETTGVGPPFQPTRCWRFQRDGSGSPTLFTHAAGIYDTRYDTGNVSGAPYLSTSWRASATGSVGNPEKLTIGATIDVDDLWAAPQDQNHEYRTRAAYSFGTWSEVESGGDIMLSVADSQQTPDWPALYVGDVGGTTVKRFFADDKPSNLVSWQWVAR